MKRVAIVLALIGCERADEHAQAQTYAIGWQSPRAGELVDVVTHSVVTGPDARTRDVHLVVEHSAVAGDRITAEHRQYLSVMSDGVAQPAGDYKLTTYGDDIEVQRLDGPLTEELRAGQVRAARLALAAPGERKGLVTHRFAIGVRYPVPPEQVETLGLGTTYDLALVLRAAHDDVLDFDITGTALGGGATIVRGTLETTGPNFRFFHEVVDVEIRDGHFHSDQLQTKP